VITGRLVEDIEGRQAGNLGDVASAALTVHRAYASH